MRKIIDIHVHTFPDKIAERAIKILSGNSHTKPFTNGTYGALRISMAEAEINFSVIQPVATNPGQVININNSAIEINKLTGSTGMHPDFKNIYGELERIYKAGIIGIKLHPVYQGVNIDDERFIKILKAASEIGLIILIHAGFDIGFPGSDEAVPKRIYNALERLETNNFKIILAHLGGWKCWDDSIKFFAGRENIYIDTAFSIDSVTPNGDGKLKDSKVLPINEFLELKNKFGAEKILFGTDSPWSSQLDQINLMESLGLSDDELNKILFENASKLLNIN